ncbi:MAG: hypothetical protein OXN94_08150 [Chloroflexota bacterium]|nr:hypothetical protein [Chloroflexota bacterium]
MSFFKTLSSRDLNLLLILLALGLVLTLGLAAWLSPAPHLTIEYKNSIVEVFADRTWVLLPNDCARIRWELERDWPIHIDGVEWRESGEQRYCPTLFATDITIELTDHLSGEYRSYSLPVFYLPDFVLNLAGVLVIPFFVLIGLQYLWINDLRRRPTLRVVLVALLVLAICATLLRLSGVELTIVGLLARFRNMVLDRRWLYGSAIVGAVFYAALAIWSISEGLRNRRYTDFLVVAGCFLVIALLYLPFGFATVAQWDEWTFRAYNEHMPWPRLDTELTLRPLLLAVPAFASSISRESFIGFNLLHAMLLWARLVMLYGILRQFKVRHLYAFLVTTIFLAYPVDARLMSLQSLNLQFSFVSLLTAVYLSLRYMANPTRLTLLGIWLALGLCIGAYESGYGLIAVAPLIWWRRFRKLTWRNLNLSFIWYIVPASKAVYIFLLLSARRSFYQSDLFYSGSEISPSELFSQTIGRLLEVYLRSFAYGWIDALQSIKQNPWLPLAVALVCALAAFAWLIWRNDQGARVPENRQLGLTLVAGLLLVVPSVGVLIWIDTYNNELLGLYLYIPVAAAIVLFCLIALLTTPITNNNFRNAAIAGLCLLLMLPALSRLFLQHEHYVTSANNKARILAQIAQLAPAIDSQTRVLVLSEMSSTEFQDKHIEAFTTTALGHALYVIYEGQGSGRGSICPTIENCFPLLHRQEYLKDTIVFLLDRDLNLELVKEPSTMLEAFVGIDYDLSRLYDADAPVPSRAYSMLGLSEE